MSARANFVKSELEKIYNNLNESYEYASIARLENNADLSRVLMAGECEMWEKIRRGEYSWLKIKSDKKKKLFRLIDIYTKFDSIVDTVKELERKVERVRKMKDAPVDSD